MADGLFETGLRISEWASVLDVELPADDPDCGFTTCWLADACAKGGYGRRFWLPRHALTGVLSYVEGARARAVRRAQRGGPYRAAARSSRVPSEMRSAVIVDRAHQMEEQPTGRRRGVQALLEHDQVHLAVRIRAV